MNYLPRFRVAVQKLNRGFRFGREIKWWPINGFHLVPRNITLKLVSAGGAN
jgi:hypothetical protein